METAVKVETAKINQQQLQEAEAELEKTINRLHDAREKRDSIKNKTPPTYCTQDSTNSALDDAQADVNLWKKRKRFWRKQVDQLSEKMDGKPKASTAKKPRHVSPTDELQRATGEDLLEALDEEEEEEEDATMVDGEDIYN